MADIPEMKPSTELRAEITRLRAYVIEMQPELGKLKTELERALAERARGEAERVERDGILYREGRDTERERILALLREPSYELIEAGRSALEMVEFPDTLFSKHQAIAVIRAIAAKLAER